MRKWLQELQTEDRMRQGYVLILPGIEGRSPFNRHVARGLAAAGVPFGIEIYDWTRRRFGCPSFLYNLRSRRLHAQQAQEITTKIVTYQQRHPHRPVFLIGHSGGGGMSILTLESLPEEVTVSGTILLGAALSPAYSLRPALQHVDRKIWSFSSMADCFFLGLFTTVCGTVDGSHSPSAGMTGFRCRDLTREEREKFEERPFRLEYFRDGNLAGHFGFTATRFVRKQIAPILLSCPTSAEALTDEFCSHLSKATLS